MTAVEQANYFRTFGFIVFRQLLSPDEIARVTDEFHVGLDEGLEGGAHDGKARHGALLMDSNTPFIASLSADPRFGGAAEQLLGKKVLGINAEANYYVGDTRWHADTGTLAYLGIKFAIYLDEVHADNGALRVIPGSHRNPFHDQLKRDREAGFYGIPGDQMPAFVFDSRPGDVLAFNLATWHSAFHGSNHRRMAAYVYYQDPDSPESLEAIQWQMHRNHEGSAKIGRQHFPSYWRSIDDKRQVWLRRLDELGILDTPSLPEGTVR